MADLMPEKAIEILKALSGEDSFEKFPQAINATIESNKKKILSLQGEIQAYTQVLQLFEELAKKWQLKEASVALRGLTIGNQSKNETLPSPAEMKAEFKATKKVAKKKAP